MQDTDFRKVRLEKLEKIKALDWNPYASSFDKEQTIADSLKSLGKKVKTAGKIFSYREHGNIAFADLKDESGKIQLFFQKKLLGENYKNLKLLDIGDYIGVEGSDKKEKRDKKDTKDKGKKSEDVKGGKKEVKSEEDEKGNKESEEEDDDTFMTRHLNRSP